MVAVLPQNHPLASKTALTFADIQEEPFILPMKGSDQDIRSITDKYIKKLDVRYTLNDDFSVISLVNHGFGITIMPELILNNFKPNVISIPLIPQQYREIGIAALPHMSILTKTFIKFLTEDRT